MRRSRTVLRQSLPWVCALSAAFGVGTGCFWGSAPPPPLSAAQIAGAERPLGQLLPLPTKDEVALVDGRPFSLGGFLALRSQLKTRAAEAPFWAGTAALALQSAAKARGVEFSVTDAVDLARYALGEVRSDDVAGALTRYFGPAHPLPLPSAVRAEADRALSRAVVQRNETALAGLRQP